MDARALRCLLVAAATLLTIVPAAAQEARSCQVPSDPDPFQDRAGLLARYERLPRSCLQEIFGACSQASSRGMLDFGSAAVCSFGYEALLRQHFGGNFDQLIAWWRTQRDDAVQ